MRRSALHSYASRKELGNGHLCNLALVVGAIATSAVCAAAPLRPADPLSESALTAALKATETSDRTGQIAAARLQLQTRAAQFPSQLGKAKVVLGTGFSGSDLQKLASAGALELVQVEAKVPVAGSSEIYTIILSGAALEEVEGGIASRIKAAQLSAQAEFRKLAATDPVSRAKYTALSQNPALIYSFESIGTNMALAALADVAGVRVVQRLKSEDLERELGEQRALRQSMQEARTAAAASTEVKLGPNVVCQTPRVVSSKSSFTNAAPNCPQEPPVPPPPPMPTTPLPVVTGEPFVDAALDGSSQFIDSYKDKDGGPGKILIPGDLLMGCDSSVPGGACPSDYTYTTRGITGGKLAWGAAIKQAGGPALGYLCGTVYHWPQNGDTQGYYAWDCWLTIVETPKWTYATAVSKMTFGSTTVAIPRYLVLNQFDTYNVPTFAWKGVAQQANGDPADCTPNGGPLDVARPCRSYTKNGNLVIGQSGFEDKVIIPNPSCHTTTFRFGTAGDKDNHCFSPDRVITNLPTPYLDTTFKDADINFTASVGVADGKQLVPGASYESRIDGSMKGWEDVRGLSARHLQAVTVRDDSGLPCITGVGGAPAGEGAACMFNVDLVRVGPDGVFR